MSAFPLLTSGLVVFQFAELGWARTALCTQVVRNRIVAGRDPKIGWSWKSRLGQIGHVSKQQANLSKDNDLFSLSTRMAKFTCQLLRTFVACPPQRTDLSSEIVLVRSIFVWGPDQHSAC